MFRFLFFSLLCVSSFNFIKAKPSFTKSKKTLLKKVYYDRKKTFYCRNPYEIKIVRGKEKTLVIKNVQTYSPRLIKTRNGKVNQRALRVEWEHIMPMENVGRQMSCWREGNSQCISKKGKIYKGRKCCKKVSQRFRKIEGDMHNLVPSIGEINGDRSNFRFRESNEGLKGQYGNCEFKIDFKNRKSYPANYTKGFISRAYLYMHEKYNIKLSKQQLKIMKIWNKKYSPTPWEVQRNKRIQKLQGNPNFLIK